MSKARSDQINDAVVVKAQTTKTTRPKRNVVTLRKWIDYASYK